MTVMSYQLCLMSTHVYAFRFELVILSEHDQFKILFESAHSGIITPEFFTIVYVKVKRALKAIFCQMRVFGIVCYRIQHCR